MSRTKKQTPAAIAESIAKYIAKQEETLKRYPVGPMANSARINLRKGQAALRALQGKNEQMKQQMEGQLQQNQDAVPQFAEGGGTNKTTPTENSAIRQALVDQNKPDQLAMFDAFKGPPFYYSDDAALAITSISEKESAGDATAVERSTYAKAGTWGENDKDNPNFTGVGKPYGDYARLRGIHGNAAAMTTEELDQIYTGSKAEQDEKFFNAMYGDGQKASVLGNTEPGDGYKFRGRGTNQLTGRANYQALSDYAFENGFVKERDYYINNPDAVATAEAVPVVTSSYYHNANFGDGMYGVDLTQPLSDAEIAAVMDNAYAVTAGASKTGDYNYASNRSLYKNSMKKMRDWNNQIRGNAPGVRKTDYSYWDDTLPDAMSGTGEYDLDTEGQIILDYLIEQHPGLGYDAEGFTPADLTQEDYKRFQRDVGITGKGVDGAIGSRSRSAYHLNRAKSLESAKTELDRKSYEQGIENELVEAQQSVRPDQDATRVATGEQQKAQVLTDPVGQVPEEPYVHRQTLPEVVIQAPRPPVTPIEEGQPMNRFYPGEDLGTPPPPPGRYPIMQIPGSPAESIQLQPAQPIDRLGPTMVPNELPQQRLHPTLVKSAPNPMVSSTPPTRQEERRARREQQREDRAAARMQPMPTPFVPPAVPGNMAAALMNPQLLSSAFRQGLAPQLPMFYDGGYTKDDLSWAGREWDLDNTKNDELLLDMNGRPAIVRDGRTGRIIHLTKRMYFEVRSAGSQQAVIDRALGRSGLMINTGDVNLGAREFPQARVTDFFLEDIGADEFENRPSATPAATPSAPADPGATQARVPNQPVARRTSSRTGFEGSRPSWREGMELYDVHGNLQGTYEGAGTIRTPEGDGRNIYRRNMREREAFYDKDGNMIGAYMGAGVFGGGRSPSAGVMGGQSLERWVQNADRRQSTATPEPRNASTENAARFSTLDEEEARQEAAAAARAGTEQTEQQQATATDLRQLPAGLPDTYNLDMGNANLINAIPAAASLASVPIMRDAVNRMERPPLPQMAEVPRFNYRSNIGQQLQDARTGVNALSRNTNLSSGQQAANRQGLLAERFRQENTLYNLDSAEYARQRNAYDQRTQQARLFNTQLRNKYAQDMQAFNNQMNLYDAQLRMQPLNVLSTSAQDYLKNVYAPSQAVALAGVGRNFNTDLLEDN